MKIICAGFPKTGTKSLAMALRELGYNVHDYEEHVNFHIESYVDIMDGRKPAEQFLEMYQNSDVEVVIDQPASTLWHLLLQQFPDAKVILMERESPDIWFQSYLNMLTLYNKSHKSWFFKIHPWFSPKLKTFQRLITLCMIRSASTDTMLLGVSPDCWKNQYIIHSAAVKQLVPKEKLLVYQVTEGWEPICKFLGKQVPDKPFPKENVAGSKGNIASKVNQFSYIAEGNAEFKRNFSLTILVGIGAGVAAYMRLKRLWQ